MIKKRSFKLFLINKYEELQEEMGFAHFFYAKLRSLQFNQYHNDTTTTFIKKPNIEAQTKTGHFSIMKILLK